MSETGLNLILRSVVNAVKTHRLRPLLADQPQRRGRPCIVGLFSTASGIGAGARLLYSAFAANGFQPSIIDLSDWLAANQPRIDFLPARRPADDDGQGPLIFHLNPPEIPLALDRIGLDRLLERYRVGYWAWELEQLPPSWHRAARYFDEVWTPSGFTAEAVQAALPSADVHCMPYLLPDAAIARDRVADWRRRLMPDGGKIVFCAFDARSSMERKNPLAAIEIFKRGAARHPDARLVVKANNLNWSQADRARLYAAVETENRRITLLSETLSDAEMASLIASSDVYLSPHRSEGFGLILVKTLLAGTPVIMTAWSGNRDFGDLPGVNLLDYTLVPVQDGSGVYGRGQRWAEPDIAHGARLLDEVLTEVRADDSRAAIADAAAARFSQSKLIGLLPDKFRKYGQQQAGQAAETAVVSADL